MKNRCCYAPDFTISKCVNTPNFTLEILFDFLKENQVSFNEKVIIEELKRRNCRKITGLAVAGFNYYFDEFGKHVKPDYESNLLSYSGRIKVEFETYGTYSWFLII